MQGDSLLLTYRAESELEKTRLFVNRNTVKAREGRKCVDGRYLPTQASGMIARPGGDCGYVMALLAVNKQKKLGLSPEQCFNAVYKAVGGGRNGHFCMHTDHHCDPDSLKHNGLIGCGHLAKAAQDRLSAEYDVDGGDVEKFVMYARNLTEILPTKLEMVNLDGEHSEAGVLIVNSRKYTVNSEEPSSQTMYFIYDKERDMKFLEHLVERMAIQGVNFAEMKREADLQLGATLHILAKSLPIYNVSFHNGEAQVVFESFVE